MQISDLHAYGTYKLTTFYLAVLVYSNFYKFCSEPALRSALNKNKPKCSIRIIVTVLFKNPNTDLEHCIDNVMLNFTPGEAA